MQSRFRVLTLILVLGAAGAARPAAQDHTDYTQADIEAGARVYSTQCATCHGLNGDLVSGIDLRRNQFRRASTDADLVRVVTNGVPGTGMPPVGLKPAEVTAVIAFIRAGFDPTARPVKIGTESRGKTIVEGKGGCLQCHRINGTGSRVAPDLSDIGIARPADAIHRSLTEPTVGMMPINRPIRITLKDGRTIAGRRLNEDTYTVQVIDTKEQLHSIAKSDVRAFVVETTSNMPSFAGKLTNEEIADVVAYLLSLKGQLP